MKGCVSGNKKVVKLCLDNLGNQSIDLNSKDINGQTHSKIAKYITR